MSNKTIKINLNDRIKVKLTDLGKQIYRESFLSINERYGREIFSKERAEPTVDEDGYTGFQLWDFMEMFGNYIGIGQANVIDPIEIIVAKGE